MDKLGLQLGLHLDITKYIINMKFKENKSFLDYIYDHSDYEEDLDFWSDDDIEYDEAVRI